MIFNICEALKNRDKQNDCKYDFLTTYQCNKYSNNTKRELIESLNNNCSDKKLEFILSRTANTEKIDLSEKFLEQFDSLDEKNSKPLNIHYYALVNTVKENGISKPTILNVCTASSIDKALMFLDPVDSEHVIEISEQKYDDYFKGQDILDEGAIWDAVKNGVKGVADAVKNINAERKNTDSYRIKQEIKDKKKDLRVAKEMEKAAKDSAKYGYHGSESSNKSNNSASSNSTSNDTNNNSNSTSFKAGSNPTFNRSRTSSNPSREEVLSPELIQQLIDSGDEATLQNIKIQAEKARQEAKKINDKLEAEEKARKKQEEEKARKAAEAQSSNTNQNEEFTKMGGNLTESESLEKCVDNHHICQGCGKPLSQCTCEVDVAKVGQKNESVKVDEDWSTETSDKSINESNNAAYDAYKKQYKGLLQDIKYVLNSDNIEDIRAYDKESQGEYILSKLFDSRMNKQNMSFEDAKEDVIDFLYRTRADAKSELELRNKRSLESKSIMNKVKSELSKDYKLVSESENTLYFKAPDNSTHDDCIAFVDKVVAVSGGEYKFTGRGGSWTQWDILTPEGSYIKAGYDYSNKDNYAVYFKSILIESRSTKSTSKVSVKDTLEVVDKSLKESLNLNEAKNIINVLNKNLGIRFKHSAGGVFFLDRTPFNTDTFDKLIKNNYKSIGDILEEKGLKYDISEDAYISKDENLYVTIYGDTSTVIVQFEEMESESLKESVNSDIVSMIKKQFPKATVKTSVRKHSDVHKSNPDTPVGKTKYVDIRITPDSASSVNSILQYCNHNIKKVLSSDERFDYYGDVPARNPRGSKEVVLSYQDYSGLSDDEYKSLLGESINPADLTDCPACGDVSFDSKRGRCTKCNYREESLNEDTQLKFDDDMIDDIEILHQWRPKEVEKILIKHGANPNNDTWITGLDLPAAYDEIMSTFRDEYSDYDEIDYDVAKVLGLEESYKLGDEVTWRGSKYIIIDDENEDLVVLRPVDRFQDSDFDDIDSGDSSEDVFLAKFQLNESLKEFLNNDITELEDGVYQHESMQLPRIGDKKKALSSNINQNEEFTNMNDIFKALNEADDCINKDTHLYEQDALTYKNDQDLEEKVERRLRQIFTDFDIDSSEAMQFSRWQEVVDWISSVIKQLKDTPLTEDLSQEEIHTSGISAYITDAINGEYDTINDYNEMLLALKDDSQDSAISVIEDIIKEEYTHIGQLQELLKMYASPSSEIKSGEVEAQKQIEETKDDQSDSEFDNEFGLNSGFDSFI